MPGTAASKGGWSDRMKDPKTVVFTRRRAAEFQAVRAAIEEAISDQHLSPGPTGGPATVDVDSLRDLAELHRQGVLTDEEYAQAKARIDPRSVSRPN